MIRTSPMPYDEACTAPGVPRAHYALLLDELRGTDLAALSARAAHVMTDLGVTFGVGHDAPAFLIDPVPRLIAADEWEALSAGIDQRVRALNAFVVDAYGPRAIVAAGVMSDHVIDHAQGYEPQLRGRLPAGVLPIPVAGLDVVRDQAGELLVLEDNCRAPSGFAYALALRQAVNAVLPLPAQPRRDIAGPVAELMGGVLRDAAPAGVTDPFTVLLSDGPANVAAWEHQHLAALTGATLVTFDALERRGTRLHARRPDGGTRPVDVLYRRCDEDRLRDQDGRPTRLAQLLLEPWASGTLGLVNGLGSGVADDKLVHAFVEEMIRFYLGQEPLLPSVPTLDLGRPERVEEVLDDLEGFVVKPRGGYGGHGVVVCVHADQDTREEVRAMLRSDPCGHIAQRTVTLSSLPTIVDGGRLQSRHVDLRPFTFSGRGWTQTLPGGLTRVALDEGALVVNSSQDGGAKDTWVLTP